jgi:hypothetical protein
MQEPTLDPSVTAPSLDELRNLVAKETEMARRKKQVRREIEKIVLGDRLFTKLADEARRLDRSLHVARLRQSKSRLAAKNAAKKTLRHESDLLEAIALERSCLDAKERNLYRQLDRRIETLLSLQLHWVTPSAE